MSASTAIEKQGSYTFGGGWLMTSSIRAVLRQFLFERLPARFVLTVNRSQKWTHTVERWPSAIPVPSNIPRITAPRAQLENEGARYVFANLIADRCLKGPGSDFPCVFQCHGDRLEWRYGVRVTKGVATAGPDDEDALALAAVFEGRPAKHFHTVAPPLDL